MDNSPLIIEQEYSATLNTVWRAITETDLLIKWFFVIAEFKPELGYSFQFEGGKENKRYIHLCEVVEVVFQEKLAYSWEYQGEAGKSIVTFELSSQSENTKLIFTHTGVESFTNPDFNKDKFLDGWNYLIKISLKEFLENGKALRYW